VLPTDPILMTKLHRLSIRNWKVTTHKCGSKS